MDQAQFQAYLDALGIIEQGRAQREHDRGTIKQDEKHLERLEKSTTRCDGSDAANVRLWLREIDLAIPQLNNDPLIALATATVAGSLRQEFERYIQAEAVARNTRRGLVPWLDIRNHITAAFLSSDESEYARKELETIKQSTTESVPGYNRRFRDLAATAYPMPRNADQHREMIRHYATGLSDDAVARTIIRHRPRHADVEAAMTTAMEVVARNDDYERLGRREASMDVGVITPPPTDRMSALEKRLDRLATKLEKLALTPRPTATPPRTPPSNRRQVRFNDDSNSKNRLPKWDNQGRPRCFECDKYGHIAADCRLRRNREAQGSGGSDRNSRNPGNGSGRTSAWSPRASDQ